MSDEQVSVALKADEKSFVQSFNNAATSVKHLADAGGFLKDKFEATANSIASDARKIKTTIAAMTAATVAYAGVSLRSFSSFQTEMANVSTVADTTSLSMGKASQAIRDLATSGGVPKTVEDLAQGLYDVNSAGFQGAAGMNVLTASAKFGVAGLTTTSVAVKGVTSLLNAYGMSAQSAGHITDILFKAVEFGSMNAEDFANNIGDWSASAAALGVSVESASAALAALTLGGLNASLSATGLNSILAMMIKPSEEMAKSYKRLGITSAKSAIEQNGFNETLQSLWESAGKDETVFAQMFQDREAFRAALTLVTTQAGKFTQFNDEMNDSIKTSGTVDAAMAKQMQTVGAQYQLFKNQVRELHLNLGAMIAGPATKTLSFFNGLIGVVNALPQPLRNVLSIFQLLTPAFTIGAIAMAGWVVKATLVKKLLTIVGSANLPVFSKIANDMVKAGGPMRYFVKGLTEIVTNSTNARAALLKTFAKGALVGVGIGALAIGIYSLVDAIQEANVKAQALKSTFGQVGSDGIKSMADLQSEYDRVVKKQNELFDSAKGNWNLFKGSLQMITPFTDNGVLNSRRASDVLAQQAKEYEDFAKLVDMVAKSTGRSADEVITSLNTMSTNGSVDIQVLSDAYKELVAMNVDSSTAKGMADYQHMLALAADLGSSMKVDINDFLPPEAAAKYLELTGLIDNAKAGMDALNATDAQAAMIADRTGSSMGDLANALLAINDAASSAGDKLSAFSTIMDTLLGNTPKMRDLQADFADAIEKVGQAMVDNGANFDLTTEGGRAVQDAMSGAAQATIALSEETLRQGGSMADATNIVSEYVSGLIAMAQNAGFGGEQIAQMIATMGLTPETIQTLFELPGMDAVFSQLGITQAMLAQLDGYVAQAGVNISITSNADITDKANNRTGGGRGTLPTDWVSDIVTGALKNIPVTKGRSGGGGGGGGGGGTPKWHMTPTQRAAVQAALAANISAALDGIGSQAAIADEAKRLKLWTATQYLNEATNKTSASIFAAADKSGEDPGDLIRDLADSYITAVGILGEAQAKMSLEMYDSAESYKGYVDELVKARDNAMAMEDWNYDNEKSSAADYLKTLRARLVGVQQYGDEWRSIMDQISAVEQDVTDKQHAKTDRERQDLKRQVDMHQVSLARYKAYLNNLLNSYVQYSDDWYSIFDEIQALEKQQADTAKEWADSIGQAMRDAFNSVVDPIKQATSLVAAFGDQSNVTLSQIQGFYDHMKEGTQRWVTVMQQLQSSGLNADTLRDLMKQGPQSLGFAESIANMGPEGISMINDSMAQIAQMAAGLGGSYAANSVGQTTQTGTIYNLDVGDVTLQFDPEGTTLTMADVQTAITAAFHDFATMINNTPTT